MSDAYLEIKPSSGRHFSYPLEQPVIRVGRDPSCDLVIEDPLLSKVHARLQLKGEGWVLVDEGSRNGTFVAGKRAAEKKEIPLKNVDDITLGLTTIRFHVGTADENAPPMKRRMRSTQEYFSINDLRGKVKDSPLPEPVVQLLVKLADDVIPEAEPTRLYHAILQVATEALKAARVGMLIQGADGQLTMVAKHPQGAPIDAPTHLYAAVIERRGVVLMRDLDAKDNVRVESGAAMALPLFSPQGVVGCLLLEAQTGEAFDEASCATGAVLGALLGPCIYQTLRYKTLQIEKAQLLSELRANLSQVIERAVIVVADSGTRDERHVGSQGSEAEGQSLKEAVASFERTYVLRVLAEQHGHRTRTAKVLGLSRQALSEKLRKYGLREEESEE